jgi:hypothetical protein
MMFAKGRRTGDFLPIAFSACYFLIHEAESALIGHGAFTLLRDAVCARLGKINAISKQLQELVLKCM